MMGPTMTMATATPPKTTTRSERCNDALTPARRCRRQRSADDADVNETARSDLSNAVTYSRPGTVVTLTVERDDKERTIAFTLEAAP